MSTLLRILGVLFLAGGILSLLDLALRIVTLSLSLRLPQDIFAFLALQGGYDLLHLKQSARKPLLIQLYSALILLALALVVQPEPTESILRFSLIDQPYLLPRSFFWPLRVTLAVTDISLIVLLSHKRTRETLT